MDNALSGLAISVYICTVNLKEQEIKVIKQMYKLQYCSRVKVQTRRK